MDRIPSIKAMYRSEYCALQNAIDRCRRDTHKQYKDYGGRGIRVCDEWQGVDGFKPFLDHIGPKPDPSLTLDRIDNDGDYEPGNVRWLSRKAQMANCRPGSHFRHVTISGRTQMVSEWATETGVPAQTIRSRLRAGVTGPALISSSRLPYTGRRQQVGRPKR